MDKLVPAFETSLFDPTLGDLCFEMAELGIDSLLDEGLFKSIPVVNLLVGTAKTAQNLHDRNLLKQTVKFINAFNSKTLPYEKKEKYRKHLNSNPQYAEEELGRVMILLNANVDDKKSELLANFFHAYIEERINWTTFCELADVTARMFIADIHLLYQIRNKQVTDTTQCESYRAERLIALGLLNSGMKSMSVGTYTGSRTEKYIQTNELGTLFCDLGK